MPPAAMVVRNAVNSARAVRPAEPIAKPLAMAAVVLPTESSESVILRMLGSMCAISAIPPALSATGPYASTPTVIAVIESMPSAASAMP